MGKRRSQDDEFLAKLADLASGFEDLTDWFDAAADAAMLEPSLAPQVDDVPPIPAQRQPAQPKDLMGGAQ